MKCNFINLIKKGSVIYKKTLCDYETFPFKKQKKNPSDIYTFPRHERVKRVLIPVIYKITIYHGVRYLICTKKLLKIKKGCLYTLQLTNNRLQKGLLLKF